MRFRPDINTAFAVGVFVASSCTGRRARPPAEAPPPERASALNAPGGPDAAFQTGFATFYAAGFTGLRTANGERYDPTQLTAAHRTLPFGTMVEVRRPDGRRVVVRINDRGPYVGTRIIDLSRRAAEELGMVHDGKAWVELRAVARAATAPSQTPTGMR